MQGGMTEPDYLQPTRFIDSGEPAVRAFAQDAVKGIAGDKARAIALYYAVRDGVAYDPYLDYTEPDVFRAGAVLAGRRGFCAGKSSLLAASARAVGIPARVGFSDVRNHLNSKRLRELVEGDTFFWHSYTEIKIDGAWVKCTPAFDRELCARARIAPLEFDGEHDSLFHLFDDAGRRHMEYLNDRGGFADVPVAAILADFRRLYPKLIAYGKSGGNFRAEVAS
jgi:transglutaminase-like putative cysteine protease